MLGVGIERHRLRLFKVHDLIEEQIPVRGIDAPHWRIKDGTQKG